MNDLFVHLKGIDQVDLGVGLVSASMQWICIFDSVVRMMICLA